MLSLPSRLHRHFRDTLDDFYDHYPLEHTPRPVCRLVNRARSLFTPGEALSSPSLHGNRFHFNVALTSFDPSEVSVRLSSDKNRLVVHAKSERKDDGGGHVYKELRQEVNVPENVAIDQMKARLDSAGYLRIEAPLKETQPSLDCSHGDKYIPIEYVR